jgi:N-acetylmuramoyl-L-alanine amidase
MIDDQWMPTLVPLPSQVNARCEGLIGFTRTETGEYYWMANSTASSVNTTGKPTAQWRNGKVLTISDLLGPNVDAQQVGDLWDINDHGLIAANSPTHGPALLVPVELVELSPRLVDEDGNEIANSHIPKHIPTRNPMVEIQPHINRIAHRELQIRLPESLAGRTIRWSMEPLFIPANSYGPAHTPVFRGSWTHAADAAHCNRFSASQDYDACGFELLSQENARTTVAENGYTAVRINLPGIGFNQARISIQIEDLMTSPKPIIDFEVPAVVVIDPGHGGHDSGALGRTDNTVLEKDLTLDYGIKLHEELKDRFREEQRNFRVVMTRNTDVYIGLQARAQIVAAEGADVFVSIHFNSANSTTARGTETFIQPTPGNINSVEDRELAEALNASTFASVLAFDAGAVNRHVREANLVVIRDGENFNGNSGDFHPSRACLIEVEFLSNEAALNSIRLPSISGDAIRDAFAESVSADIFNDILNQP